MKLIKDIYSKYSKGINISIAFIVGITLLDVFTGVRDEYASNLQKWEDLKAKSENHAFIVSAYRDCRVDKRAERKGGSVNFCRIVAANHAKMKEISEEDIRKVYWDLVSTTESMDRVFKRED